MLHTVMAIGRFWLVRLCWLLVALLVLIVVSHVPHGFIAPAEVEPEGPRYSQPVPKGFFMIEPWELRSGSVTSQGWTWDVKLVWEAAKKYTTDLVNGDLVYSRGWGTDPEPVTDVIKASFPKTLRLFAGGLAGGLLVGIVGGIVAIALRLLRPPMLGFSVAGLSVPDFLMVIGGQQLAIWSYREFGFRPWSVGVPGSERHWVLPTLVLLIPVAAYSVRLAIASLDDIMQEDYIRTARAKGLGRVRILFGHALRNAVPRLLNGLPALVNVTLSSLIVVEYLTSWSGLGLLLSPWSSPSLAVRLTATLVYAIWFAVVEGLAQTLRLAASPRLREVQS